MRAILLSIILLLLFQPALEAQNKDESLKTIQTDAGMLQRMMENFHCCARTLDEQYCKDVATLFLRNMDPLRIYFKEDEVKQLRNIESLNAELSGRSHSYSDKAVGLFKQGLTRTDALVTEVVQVPFDFARNENYYFEEDSSDFAANDKDLRERVYKLLKYQTLDRLMEAVLADSALATIPLSEREPKERGVIGKRRHRRINHRLESRWGFENYVKMLLADAIVKANDPHSGFIPEMTWKRNANLVYGNAHSFGLILLENFKGDVVVGGLVPGSSAWKSAVLNKDDILVALQWEDLPSNDLEGADVDEVDQLFGEKRYRKLKLTVRKSDGQLKTVVLTKGRYYEGANHVETYKLDGPVKIAYVILPSFYGDWESTYGSSCARDVNKALEKLQFEVDGLILDMRFNGGGSLSEANELAGIFIDEGTLGFMKQRGGFSKEMKDPYLGTLYQEPMVVLVNNESASATEYVAAALQDYNRAVIVGSPTFGKATAQRNLPADTGMDRLDMNRGIYDTKIKDQVKITMGKLYRATGKSLQQKGVQPDIILPNVYDSIGYRESLMKHALVSDTIHRIGKFDKFAPLPINELREKSEQRVKADPSFRLVEKARKIIAEKGRLDEKPVSLRYSDYIEMSKNYYGAGRKIIKQIQQDSMRVYQVSSHSREKPDPRDEPDPIEIEIMNNTYRQISKDIYVNEAYAILTDLLKINKDKK